MNGNKSEFNEFKERKEHLVELCKYFESTIGRLDEELAAKNKQIKILQQVLYDAYKHLRKIEPHRQ